MLMSGLVYLVKMAILLIILYIFFKIMQIVLFTDVQNSVLLFLFPREMCLVMKIMLLVIALRFKKLVDLFLMQVLHKWRLNYFLKLLFYVNTRHC